MERDQMKRSRAVEGGGGQKKKGREMKGKDETSTTVEVSSPTEDEFDEFSAIVRRMQEAVKYYANTRGGVVDGGRELKKTVFLPEESPSRGADGVEEVRRKKKEIIGVLDLNTVPETEINSLSM